MRVRHAVGLLFICGCYMLAEGLTLSKKPGQPNSGSGEKKPEKHPEKEHPKGKEQPQGPDFFHLGTKTPPVKGVTLRTNQTLCWEMRVFCSNSIDFCQENAGKYADNFGHQLYDFVYPAIDMAVDQGFSPGIIWWRFNILPAVKELLQIVFPKTRINAGLGFPQPPGCAINLRKTLHQRAVLFSRLSKDGQGASTWPRQGANAADALRAAVFDKCGLKTVDEAKDKLLVRVLVPERNNNVTYCNKKRHPMVSQRGLAEDVEVGLKSSLQKAYEVPPDDQPDRKKKKGRRRLHQLPADTAPRSPIPSVGPPEDIQTSPQSSNDTTTTAPANISNIPISQSAGVDSGTAAMEPPPVDGNVTAQPVDNSSPTAATEPAAEPVDEFMEAATSDGSVRTVAVISLNATSPPPPPAPQPAVQVVVEKLTIPADKPGKLCQQAARFTGAHAIFSANGAHLALAPLLTPKHSMLVEVNPWESHDTHYTLTALRTTGIGYERICGRKPKESDGRKCNKGEGKKDEECRAYYRECFKAGVGGTGCTGCECAGPVMHKVIELIRDVR
mmetsp:Transcript_28383/g.62151  ORF Transcript_28383/g.62151 Transcript_28383/m.62151 type:complete len:556 (-) Transcript_28383:121-1788(-)|eukprot:CAMPEP_0118936638 /NCGR_PEP_ID=MMETSP1169-20130426/19772_1 /TAXON_ID=36882 /ORGANISM="Pyramimonas obovata, Strain CCMP722" /LENGTH=555 /DNA_ID=CAMNT_0006879961 /DNA_START=173 /DNA_END=1840 /DNA_ORIENTATION=+